MIACNVYLFNAIGNDLRIDLALVNDQSKYNRLRLKRRVILFAFARKARQRTVRPI